jgi:hypothetical protein
LTTLLNVEERNRWTETVFLIAAGRKRERIMTRLVGFFLYFLLTTGSIITTEKKCYTNIIVHDRAYCNNAFGCQKRVRIPCEPAQTPPPSLLPPTTPTTSAAEESSLVSTATEPITFERALKDGAAYREMQKEATDAEVSCFDVVYSLRVFYRSFFYNPIKSSLFMCNDRTPHMLPQMH